MEPEAVDDQSDEVNGGEQGGIADSREGKSGDLDGAGQVQRHGGENTHGYD